MQNINKIADYIIWLHHDSGDVITNLRLQKLLYYAQAWYLVLYDEPLFEEDFEAWIHGPVMPPVYKRFKAYKWNPINEEIKKPKLSEKVEKHLNEIVRVFGQYSSLDLEYMTHREAPWVKARNGCMPDEVSSAQIDKEEMKSFYKSL